MNVVKHKYIIIGAGPGGLQMGHFLQKSERDYLVLEKNPTAGSFFSQFPIHRKLISINKKHNFYEEEEFNMRHDWNSLLSDDPELRFTKYTDELFASADVLYQYLQDFARKTEVNIAHGTVVKTVSKQSDGSFHIATKEGPDYQCEVLLLGLGSIKPLIPDEVEGIELTTNYDELELDKERYVNKRVCVIGQGNSAFETADYLSDTASFVHVFLKRPLKMAWDSHFVGDLRAVNNSILDMYQLKSLHAVLNPRLRKITRLENGCLQTTHEYDYPHSKEPGTLMLTREYDEIICCAGFKWVDDAIFDDSCRPATWNRGKYPSLNTVWESENVPNMFFIGGAMQGNDRQASSGFIHGFRYNIRSLFKLLEERFEDVPYPVERKPEFEWDGLLDDMYDRFSNSAAMFQMFGVLVDVLVFSDDMKEVEIHREMPLPHVRERFLNGDRHVLVLSLEFGFKHFEESSITFLGPSDPNDTQCAAFLHPVVRHLRAGREEEFHFGDSLLGRWDRPHGEGGAVMSYHYEFQQWIEANLGVDLRLPEPVEGGPFRKWSKEEIAAWRKANEMEKPDYKCMRPI